MKLLVLSDLHMEFGSFSPDACAVLEADVVVLAGDLHRGARACQWIAAAFPGKPAIYVAGNHEFYGGHWDHTLDAIRAEARRYEVHFLEDDEVLVNGIRFLGCTLWTDFSYFGTGDRQIQAMKDYRDGLNDCWSISAGVGGHDGVAVCTRWLAPQEVLTRHLASRRWLESRLSTRWDGRTVVVTHHLPSSRSVEDKYKNDKFTVGFASMLPDAVLTAADLWIHGHTHRSCDYDVRGEAGTVRIVCNPRGYPRRSGVENVAFNSGLLVDV